MTSLVRIAIAAFFVSFSYLSCSSVEQEAACGSVCTRYSGCFDAELDAGDCASDCLDGADRATFPAEVVRCEQCMDFEGCGESAFDCFDECGAAMGQTARLLL